MAFYDDAEITEDKARIKSLKDTYVSLMINANSYIDTIVNDRYGDLTRYTSSLDSIKASIEALKIKYPIQVVQDELNGYLDIIEADVLSVVSRWDTEVYNKIKAV